jgi:hypothetical protein
LNFKAKAFMLNGLTTLRLRTTHMKNARFKTKVVFAAILALLMGTANGLLLLYIGFTENTQGEYYDPLTKAVDLPYSAEMFLISFLPAAIITFWAALVIATFSKNK